MLVQEQVSSSSPADADPHRIVRLRGHALRSVGPPLALVVLCVVFTVLNPRFLSVANLQAVADQAAPLMVVALGATFVILLGSVDLSVDGVMAATALCLSLLIANSENGSDLGWLGVLAAVAVGAGFGLANGVLHTRLRIPSFMVTLGTWWIGLGVATVLFGSQTPQIKDRGLRALALHGALGLSP